jgi:glycosyltransferase involved in cell wall biosynthesis
MRTATSPATVGPRLRICAVVVSHLPHDARVWKEARSLTAAGHRVELIGMHYGLQRTRTYVAEGVRVTEIPFGERGSSSTVLGRARSLARIWSRAIRARADVYWCHNVHPAPPLLFASLVRRRRLVYDAHELYGEVKPGAGPASRLSAAMTRAVERALARRATSVLTTNPSRAGVMCSRYPYADISVVANVPPTVERVEALDPRFPSGTTLLYQGGIYAEARAFRSVIAALRMLDGVSFEIVGFGRDADIEAIRRWSAEFGVADRVHLHRPVPFDQLVRIAASATVGIVPLRNISQNSYLGDTNKLFEYLMAGLPVVGSNFPEVARVLTEGSPPVGAVFDPEDPASVAAAVDEVLSDRLEERRSEARRLAVERFNWTREEPELLRCLLDSGIGVHKPAGGRRSAMRFGNGANVRPKVRN